MAVSGAGKNQRRSAGISADNTGYNANHTQVPRIVEFNNAGRQSIRRVARNSFKAWFC